MVMKLSVWIIFPRENRKIFNSFFLIQNFKLIVGDIRNISDCKNAVDGVDYVFHEAALGSVPRSIKDPITTNSVNIDGFLNMLVVSRDVGVKRFIYRSELIDLWG